MLLSRVGVRQASTRRVATGNILRRVTHTNRLQPLYHRYNNLVCQVACRSSWLQSRSSSKSWHVLSRGRRLCPKLPNLISNFGVNGRLTKIGMASGPRSSSMRLILLVWWTSTSLRIVEALASVFWKIVSLLKNSLMAVLESCIHPGLCPPKFFLGRQCWQMTWPKLLCS
jgi:hypothetical protein